DRTHDRIADEMLGVVDEAEIGLVAGADKMREGDVPARSELDHEGAEIPALADERHAARPEVLAVGGLAEARDRAGFRIDEADRVRPAQPDAVAPCDGGDLLFHHTAALIDLAEARCE